MTDSLLIYTFSPIQSFIAEARRAEDLYKGSKILSYLANAACEKIGKELLIYPAEFNRNDTPNVLVIKVPDGRSAKDVADLAQRAMQEEWETIIGDALHEFHISETWMDEQWKTTWRRQTGSFWEVYWAAAPYEKGKYKQAYADSRKTLDAVKRSRLFGQPEGGEQGEKDSLSGRRQALYMANVPNIGVRESPAKAYWRQIAAQPGITKSKLKPNGRERLDSMAVIKRFAKGDSFPSTSSVAVGDFGSGKRKVYTEVLDKLVDKKGGKLFTVSKDPEFPYDGDLLYTEALTVKYLKDSYDLDFDKADTAKGGKLWNAREALKDLHKEVGGAPSKYYAIIRLDGDGMGKYIDEKCREENDHREFSGKIANFSKAVQVIIAKHNGSLIFNGGDDVLCMAPLASALPLAWELAEVFNKETPCTASAGLAITHHQSPLDAALDAARNAEHRAKEMDEVKNAVCVRAIKRSGETLEVLSKWAGAGTNFGGLVEMFRSDALSSRFAYDTKRSAYALSAGGDMWQAELKRLIRRHRDDNTGPDPLSLSEQLNVWTNSLPNQSTDQLADWLILARFVAQGGGE